jgi:hypothetical protein
MRGSTRSVNGLDGRNRVIMLNPGNITTEQARTLLDVALTEAFFCADSADALTDCHGTILRRVLRID